MKVFVFVRGVDTSFKRSVVTELMTGLNPDINSVSAIRVSIEDKLPRYFAPPDSKRKKQDLRAADKDCKNLTRKVLAGSHSEQFIVIDNESIQPQHWQSYYNISNKAHVDALAVGIDVYSGEKFNTDAEKQKNIEQGAKSTLFKASVYKYYRVKSEDDIPGVIEDIIKLKKEN